MPPQQSSQAAEKRWRFTSDELAKIQEQLEEILIPSSNSKSTLSEIQFFTSDSEHCFRRSRFSNKEVPGKKYVVWY